MKIKSHIKFRPGEMSPLQAPENDFKKKKKAGPGKEINRKTGRTVVRAPKGLSKKGFKKARAKCNMKETRKEQIKTAPIPYPMPRVVLSWLVLLPVQIIIIKFQNFHHLLTPPPSDLFPVSSHPHSTHF